MPASESLLSIACCGSTGVAFLAFAGLLIARSLLDRSAIAALRSQGWAAPGLEDPGLAEALADLELDDPQARYPAVLRHGEGPHAIWIVKQRVPQRGGIDMVLFGGVTTTFAIAPRAPGGPLGRVSRRAAGFGSIAGPQRFEPSGWSWAFFAQPSPIETWSAAAGAATAPLLRPGEHVRLAARHVAIAMRGGSLAAHAREGRERLDALRAAIAR